MNSITKHPIADSVWIAGGQLLTGAGHQMIQAKPGFSFRDNAPSKDLFETVARHNGPLPDYHPQMLLQCLLWGPSLSQRRLTVANVALEKIAVVKQIIVRLAQGLKYLTPEERATFELPSLPVESFLEGQDSMARETVSYRGELELKLKISGRKPRSFYSMSHACGYLRPNVCLYLTFE
jgi:RAVE protein 1 C terminal